MLRIRVIPCLLLHKGGLVKTTQFKNPQYVGDPINVVRIFNEFEVDELVFLDIGATINQSSPPFKQIQQIASECFMPIAYGGGINNLEDVRQILASGVEKIIVNSYAAKNPSFITQIASTFGSQSVVVSVDVMKSFTGSYYVRTHSGTRTIRKDLITFVKEIESSGAGEILLTSIKQEGTWRGFDVELIRRISESVSLPLIAHGGAGSIADLKNAVEQGKASAVAVGSMVVYQGKDLGVLVSFPPRKELEEIFSP